MQSRVFWLILFAATVGTLRAEVVEQSPLEKVTEAEIQELDDLLKAGTDGPDAIALAKLNSKSPIVKAMAVSILYRADPRSYEKQLYESFSIHDYVARSSGRYNMIKPEEIIAQVKNIEKQFPDVTDNRLQLLLLFHYYRDRNEWTGEGKKRLSPARIFRGAFLAIMCKDTEIDTEKITNEIDRRASKEDREKSSNDSKNADTSTD